MFDISGLGAALLGYGPAGMIIAYLLYDRNRLEQRLEKTQADFVSFIQTNSEKLSTALVSSTEVIRASTAASLNTAESAKQLAIAFGGFKDEIERLGRTVEGRNGVR